MRNELIKDRMMDEDMLALATIQRYFNKLLKFILIGLIALFFVILTASVVSAEIQISFNDTFDRADSGTVGNSWVETELGSGSSEIKNNQLYLYDPDTSSTSGAEHSISFPNTEIVYFNWTINVSSVSGSAGQYMPLWFLSNAGFTKYCIDINLYNDGGTWKYSHYTSGFNTLDPITVNQIDMNSLVINLTGGTYDWIVNGAVMGDDVEFRDQTCAYSDFELLDSIGRFAGTSATNWFDDVIIYNGTEEAPAAPPASNETYENTVIPGYSFSLTTNLTQGNYTDDPMTWAVSGTYNYTYSISDYHTYWRFEGNADDERGYNNGTVNGATLTTGYDGQGYAFDGTNDYISIIDFNETGGAGTELSVFAWVKVDEVVENSCAAGHTDSASWSMCINSNKWVMNVFGNTAGGNQISSIQDNTIQTGVWQHIGFSFDAGGLKQYVDGEEQTNIFYNDTNNLIADSNTNILIGAVLTAGNPTGFFNGSIDEVRIYNRSVKNDEVSMIYASSYPLFNCSLYVNGTITNEKGLLNLTAGSDIEWDTTGLEAGYLLNITCTDYWKIDSEQSSLFVDSVQPDITQGDITNNTVLYHNINNINISVTYSDTNLFYANLSIQKLNTDLTWNQTINYTEATDINITSYTLNITNNINSLAPGLYKLNTFAADSHTAIDVKDIGWYWLEGKLYAGDLIFEGSMKDVNNKGNLVTYFYEDFDRYKMKVTFDDQALSHQITITAPDWQYVGDRYGYKGHFISLKDKRWLDFMGQNIKDVVVTPLGSNRYLIEVEHYYSTDEIEFESIGDLNIIEQDYYFNISTGFSFSAIDAISSLAINSFSVSIINGTDVLQTKSTTTGNLTFSYFGNYSTNVTAAGYVNNGTSNISMFSGGTFQYNLFATNSLYLFFYDESTDRLINSTNVTVTVINLANTSQENMTDKGSLFISNFATGDYELQFDAPGYSSNSYFVTISSGTTQTLDLYLINESLTSLIVFNLADEKGDPIYDATIKRKRFMLNDNAYIVTGMSKTDSNGETAMYLIPNDVFYQFVVDKDGETLYSGNSQKVFASTVYLRISLLEDIFQSYNLVHGNLGYSLDWDNDTDIVSVTYNDPTNLVLRGCLQVVEKDIFTQTYYGPNCTTSASATIQINMSGLTNNRSQYFAQFYVETNSTYSEPLVAQIVKTYSSTFAQFGDSGLFTAYLFIGTMFFVGLPISFSVALIYSIISMFVVQVMGVSFLGWSFMITVSVIGIIVGSVIKN